MIKNPYTEKSRELPSLPIPILEETCKRYLRRIKPLITAEDYKVSEKKVNYFLNGSGQLLQKKLLKWDSECNGSWLKPFWDESYLAYRDCIVGNINPAQEWWSDRYMPELPFSKYCARIIMANVEAYCIMARGELKWDYAKETPLCMEAMGKVMRVCRIPQIDCDKLVYGDFSTKNIKVMVMYNDNIYLITVTDEEGKVFSLDSIADAIEKILNFKDSGELRVGSLTLAKRDTAAILHERLKNISERNANNFKLIEDSIFPFSIDEREIGKNDSEIVKEMLMPCGRNRYYDKSYSVMVGTDYTVGTNEEHSGSDGLNLLKLTDIVSDKITDANYPMNLENYNNDEVIINRLQWDGKEKFEEDIKKIEVEYRKLADSLNVYCWNTEINKEHAKSVKMSPDSFFHIALQLAQFRLFGKIFSTYEAASVRKFYQGRTECIRPSTSEALEFVRAVERKESKDKLIELARIAAAAHRQDTMECQEGMGPERHLLGLMMMQNKFGEQVVLNENEDIFNDIGYKTLKHDTFSTSSMPAFNMKYFSFAPVVEDGFGVAYGIEKEGYKITLTSWEKQKDMLPRLVDMIETSLKDLYVILKEESM